MRWTIVEEFKSKSRIYVRVICNCGIKGIRRKDHVLSGRTTCCKKCSASMTLKKFPNKRFGPRPHGGIGDISLTLWGCIKSCADVRGLDFKISLRYAWALFKKQDSKCALSGKNINLKHGYKNSNVNWADITASLDRIDSTKGYVQGNVQWVHKVVNRMKGDLPENIFIDYCASITRKALGL